MKTGDKIKYVRKQLGITQDRLAELCGIHPVSIRKYETNKMQPLPPQLEKIAAALGISYNALDGNSTAGLRLETVGDLIGVLMVLYNSKLLQITGERGEDQLLKEETVSIHFNPVLEPFLAIDYKTKKRTQTISIQDILLIIKSYLVLRDFLKWEKIRFIYSSACEAAGTNPDEATQTALDEIFETKEKIELELQRNQSPLNIENTRT